MVDFPAPGGPERKYIFPSFSGAGVICGQLQEMIQVKHFFKEPFTNDVSQIFRHF